jgi:hypothetical protein
MLQMDEERPILRRLASRLLAWQTQVALDEDAVKRRRRTLAVGDKMRDKFRESAVSLASGLLNALRERTQRESGRPFPPRKIIASPAG